jgi:hypothetical protein
MEVFFIDDRTENLEAWRTAMEQICGGEAELSVFSSVDELKQAITEGYRPVAGFIDFFVETYYGHAIVAMLRDMLGDRVSLIGHSSMKSANEGMMRAGADCWMPKRKGVNPSPMLLELFNNLDDFHCFIDKNKTSEGTRS